MFDKVIERSYGINNGEAIGLLKRLGANMKAFRYDGETLCEDCKIEGSRSFAISSNVQCANCEEEIEVDLDEEEVDADDEEEEEEEEISLDLDEEEVDADADDEEIISRWREKKISSKISSVKEQIHFGLGSPLEIPEEVLKASDEDETEEEEEGYHPLPSLDKQEEEAPKKATSCAKPARKEISFTPQAPAGKEAPRKRTPEERRANLARWCEMYDTPPQNTTHTEPNLPVILPA